MLLDRNAPPVNTMVIKTSPAASHIRTSIKRSREGEGPEDVLEDHEGWTVYSVTIWKIVLDRVLAPDQA